MTINRNRIAEIKRRRAEETEKEALRVTARIATRQLILEDELSEDEMTALVSVYPSYKVGVTYKPGDIFAHSGQLFEVIQEHTSQADWQPGNAPSLYKSKTPKGLIPNWVQPQGAHDAYAVGSIVKHKGKIWTSTVDDNVWEPGVHGWEEE